MKNPFFYAICLCIIGCLSVGQNFIVVQTVGAICLLLTTFKETKLLFKRFLTTNWSLVLFCLLICFSSFWSYYALAGEFKALGAFKFSPLRGCLYAFVLFQYYLAVESLILHNKLGRVLDILSLFVFLILFVQDIDILFIHTRLEESADLYLIGDKYTITYLHLFYIALISGVRKKTSYVLSFILIIITFIIAQKTFCSTGKVLSVLMYILVILKPYLEKFLSSRTTLLLAIVLSILFAFFPTFVLEQNVIDHFVRDTLGEDYTVTGRVRIYEVLTQIVSQSPWVGYGHGNSSFIVSAYIGFGNAQNGFLDTTVNYGIIGTLLIIFIALTCFNFSPHRRIDNRTFMFVVVVYLMLIAATMEITINTIFLCILPLLLINNKCLYDAKQH